MFLLRMQVLVLSLRPWQCRQAILLVHGLWLLCLISRILLGTTSIIWNIMTGTIRNKWRARQIRCTNDYQLPSCYATPLFSNIKHVFEIVYIRHFKHDRRCFHHMQPQSAASCHFQSSGCAISFSDLEVDFDKGVSWRLGALNFQLKDFIISYLKPDIW